MRWWRVTSSPASPVTPDGLQQGCASQVLAEHAEPMDPTLRKACLALAMCRTADLGIAKEEDTFTACRRPRSARAVAVPQTGSVTLPGLRHCGSASVRTSTGSPCSGLGFFSTMVYWRPCTTFEEESAKRLGIVGVREVGRRRMAVNLWWQSCVNELVVPTMRTLLGPPSRTL